MLSKLQQVWMKVLLMLESLIIHHIHFFLFVYLFNFALCSLIAALEALVEKRVTGFPVIDDDWKLVTF